MRTNRVADWSLARSAQPMKRPNEVTLLNIVLHFVVIIRVIAILTLMTIFVHF